MRVSAQFGGSLHSLLKPGHCGLTSRTIAYWYLEAPTQNPYQQPLEFYN